MIKEAIEHIEQMSDDPIQEIGDRRFLKHGFNEVVPPTPNEVQFFSLTSFVEFIRMTETHRDAAFVHIMAPTRVEFISELTDRETRKTYAMAGPLIDGHFDVGHWMTQDRIVTEIQAYFSDEADRAKLLRVVGNVKSSDSVTLEDDGVTQKVATAAGIVAKQMEEMPNPVILHPFETFPEIDQPAREYVVRFRGGAEHEKVTFALFAVPDPTFSFNACTAIKEWLEEHLPSGMIVLG